MHLRKALLGLITTGLLGAASARADDAGLDVYFIDTQGGAATLVVTPDRESILVDTGWPGEDDRDPKRIEHVLKNVAGLDHLDHLLITHWHIDHVGGVGGLARRLEVRHFWDRGLPEDNAPDVDFPEGPRVGDRLGDAYRTASAGKRTRMSAGDRLPLKGPATAQAVTSSKHVLETAGKENALAPTAPADQPDDRSDNARSLGLLFDYNGFRFLDVGDLTWNIEKNLVVPVDRIGPVDLYQVTHHGLDISNNPILLQTIAPTVAVMNNGPRKGGSAETVRRLKALPSLKGFYSLHRNQQTRAADNADPAYIANTEPSGGQFIHVHVPPTGKTFTVQIGTDGETRTYEIRGR